LKELGEPFKLFKNWVEEEEKQIVSPVFKQDEEIFGLKALFFGVGNLEVRFESIILPKNSFNAVCKDQPSGFTRRNQFWRVFSGHGSSSSWFSDSSRKFRENPTSFATS